MAGSLHGGHPREGGVGGGGGGEILRCFIKRANQFNSMFRGKGFAEYYSFAKNKELTAHATKVYATPRFASS